MAPEWGRIWNLELPVCWFGTGFWLESKDERFYNFVTYDGVWQTICSGSAPKSTNFEHCTFANVVQCICTCHASSNWNVCCLSDRFFGPTNDHIFNIRLTILRKTHSYRTDKRHASHQQRILDPLHDCRVAYMCLSWIRCRIWLRSHVNFFAFKWIVQFAPIKYAQNISPWWKTTNTFPRRLAEIPQLASVNRCTPRRWPYGWGWNPKAGEQMGGGCGDHVKKCYIA